MKTEGNPDRLLDLIDERGSIPHISKTRSQSADKAAIEQPVATPGFSHYLFWSGSRSLLKQDRLNPAVGLFATTDRDTYMAATNL